MKPIVITLAATLALATASFAQDAVKPLALGSKAPLADVKMKTADGREVSIAGVAGSKGTLVVFTCNHCPWAKMWEARIAEIGNRAIKKGLGVVAINSNDPAAYPDDDLDGMKSRAKKLGLQFAYAVDATSDIARAFGASKTPEAFLFDAKGDLVYHGTIDDNAREPKSVKEPWLRQAVDAVLAGKAVATAETKALGCGIKYRAKTAS